MVGGSPHREGGEGEDFRQSPRVSQHRLDEERTKAEAAQQKYLDKIEAHTVRGKLVLNLDKILGEKSAELDERE
jgi:predicted NUDIX family NTP pyrophosphohydrolase